MKKDTVRFTIDLNTVVHQEFKQACVKHKKSMRFVMEELIKAFLQQKK